MTKTFSLKVPAWLLNEIILPDFLILTLHQLYRLIGKGAGRQPDENNFRVIPDKRYSKPEWEVPANEL